MTPKSILKFYIVPILFLLHTSIFGQLSYESAFPNLTFNFPVEMQAPPDGSNRLCIVEQPGIIKIFNNDPDTTENEVVTFLDITSKVAYSSGQEIGLLGLAFHPQFISNGHVFVYFIDKPSSYRINVVRYTVSQQNPNILDANSEFVIAQYLKNQNDSNHNGGKIAFGPDGYLYLSIGDGGGGGDPQKNGQNLETVFGSILRIDIDVNGDNPLEANPEQPDGHYEIPNDNPRLGQAGLDELFAWGVRNTWKFSFDNEGRLWGADVGQNAYEEINLIEKGGNYGWNRFEADSQPSYGAESTLATSPDIKPIFFYNHNAGDVSITGGFIYRGSLVDERLQNAYIYGDYVSGRIWALRYEETSETVSNELLFKTNGSYISSFGEDEFGELYFLGYSNAAKIYRLASNTSEPETVPVNGVGNWEAIDPGTNGTVECMITDFNGNLIVGGNFSSAGDIPVSYLALYNTTGIWNALSPGSNGPILDMAMASDGKLFVAGDFSEIGGIAANNIAFYDGENWNSLDTGTNGPISKITFDKSGSILYAGGIFSMAGETMVNNIARWENESWQGLTDSNTDVTGTNNEIRAIAFDDENNLYIGGNFDMAGGIRANRIAKWDGTNWDSLGDGTSGFVQAIVLNDGFVYAGGNFVNAGNKTVRRIARFHMQSQTWETLGNGVSGNVNDMAWHNGQLYVTGTFTTASDIDIEHKVVNNVARWNSTLGWQALGTGTNVGIDNRGNALLFLKDSDELIIGGNFSRVGAAPNVNNIAKWSILDNDGDGVDDTIDACPDTPANVEITENGCPILPFPSDQFTIKSIGTSCINTANGSINIISKTSGEFIAVLSANNAIESFNFDSSLTISNLAPGSYNLCLQSSTGEFFEVCSVVSVGEPEPLSVLTSMDFLNKTVTLKVDGATNYIVELNDKIIESSSNLITLPLDRINNELVVTSKECQGSYSETIILEDSLMAYPSPFKDILNIDLSNLQNEGAEINIFDITGKLVLNDKFIASENLRTLNTSNLFSGLYFVQLKIGRVVKVIKVIKS